MKTKIVCNKKTGEILSTLPENSQVDLVVIELEVPKGKILQGLKVVKNNLEPIYIEETDSNTQLKKLNEEITNLQLAITELLESLSN